ncbi:MAG: 23S rRNA (pseudouridine(1915)-N(3))-methyltransferase RlmH [Bacteroidales bacterium]|jgi:23S rRNA (pseudouridine1915-N3)-methyltransferase|nr:23S rRNA (pseudouridine(1915)-N(3))-methyltransferase RlmH [Bacteroidales bacterium]
MKITLLVIGKTVNGYLKTGEDDYLKRLKFYGDVDYMVVNSIKNAKSMSEAQQKEEEGKLFLTKIMSSDFCVLLDEKGKMYTSEEFSGFLNSKAVSGLKNLVFVIGGPYGFSDAIYRRADLKLSLSSMTFSHQMVRMIFLEQLYRAFTILRNEPYHHK